MSKYSQFNEEEVLASAITPDTPKFFVEIGCLENGRLSNTFHLKEKGWVGHWFDKDPYPGIISEFITKENINEVLRRYNTPEEIGVMSIDVDGNDYWLFDALEFRPHIIVIEFNPHKQSGIFTYDPEYVWDNRSNAFGSSKTDLIALAEKKGYHYFGETNTNLILCRNQ